MTKPHSALLLGERRNGFWTIWQGLDEGETSPKRSLHL